MSHTSWLRSFGEEPVVSYSQNAEDIRLWRVFRTVENGFYVDVGAADPRVDSVTCLFYEHGWSGINVEPSPIFDDLRKARPRDVNLNLVVGETEQSTRFFLTYPYLGLSTLDMSVHAQASAAIDQVDEITVPQRRLDSILSEHVGDRAIHFLKVDVEGAEHEVLASSDWTAFRPVVVVVESIEPLSTTSTHERWESILLDARYRFAAFDGINRFYVEARHDHLIPALAYPVSALDGFVKAAVVDLEREVARRATEMERLGTELDTIYRSRTWRAGRLVATATSPIRTLGRRWRTRSR